MGLINIEDLISIEEEFKTADALEVWDYLTKLTQEVMTGDIRFEKQPSRIVLWKDYKNGNLTKSKRILTVNPSTRKKQVTLYNYPEIQETKENRKVVTKENYREVLQQAFKSIIENEHK